MFDVTEFTAIINPPESAILAVGAVRKVPVVKDDQLAVGHRMKVTLSSDHRVVDGALAAQFLAEVRRLLENPVSLLLYVNGRRRSLAPESTPIGEEPRPGPSKSGRGRREPWATKRSVSW